MEETKSARKRGEGSRGILQAFSSNLSRKNQQLTTSSSFPRRADTQYRFCTGETYQLAHLPPPLANSISEITDEAEELIDLDAADLLESVSSPQIDTPPDSDASADSDSFDELISSSTYSEPQQFFRPVISRSQISLVPVYKGTSIRRRENTDNSLGTAFFHRIMEVASNADAAGSAVLLGILGIHNGYGIGPDFDGANSQLRSIYQRKNLEIELNAKSKPGSSGLKAYAMGFNVNLFCRKVRAGCCSGSSMRSKGDISKPGFCPYEVITTREQFQHHINKMILVRKKAWNDICQQFDPPAVTAEIDPDFEALAAAFFGGLEVPEKPFPAPTKGANSYTITQNTGDRVKALETNPLHDDELVVFLEDCMFSNEIEIAQRTGERYWNLEVRNGPKHPGYRAIVALEEEIMVLDQSTADDGPETFKGQFAKVKLLKTLFDQVPEAIVDISQSEVLASQNDRDKVGNVGTAKSQGISGLEWIVVNEKSKSGCVSAECISQPQLDLEPSSAGTIPTENLALTDSAIIAGGEATQSKSKKKKNKNKKNKKKPAGQQKSAAEASVVDGSTFDEPYVQETVGSLTIEELSSRDASVLEDEAEVLKTEISQVVHQDSTSESIETVVLRTNGEVAANAVDGGQWQTVGKGKLKLKQSREDALGEIANTNLAPGPSTQSNSLIKEFPSCQVAVPLIMKNSSANKTPQGKKFVESKSSPTSSKRMNVTEQHVPVPMVTNIKCAKIIRSDVRHFDESEYPAMPSKALNPTRQSHKIGAEVQIQAQKAANLRVFPSASGDPNATEQNRPAYAATNAKTRSTKREVRTTAPKASYNSSIVVHLSPNVNVSQRLPSEVPSPTKALATKHNATRPVSEKRSGGSARRRNRKKGIAAQLTYGTEQGTSVVASTDHDIEIEAEGETNASNAAQTPDTENVDFSSSSVPANGIEVADQSAHDNHTKKFSQILVAVDLTSSFPMEEEKPETSTPLHPAGDTESGRTSFHMPRSRSQETSSRNAQYRPQISAGECRATQPLEEIDDTHDSEILVEHPASANQVLSADFHTQIQNSRESGQNMDTSCGLIKIPYPHYNHVPVAYNGTPSHLGPDSQYESFGLYNTRVPAQIFGNASHRFIGMVDTHAHPTTSNNFAVGNSFYLRPSEKDQALEPVQRSSLKVLSCAFCQFTINVKPQYPASLCPFCVGDGAAVYCSTACQLADSYDHCMSCQHCPSYNNASVSPPVPNSLWRIENYPIRSLSYDPLSPECFRQKTFSMFCRTGQFPNLLGLWTLYKQFLPNKAHHTPEDKKHIGDYFVFRSAITTGSPDHPSTDVICAISLDPRDAMKLCLRRLINACYIQPMEPFVGALFRTLRYLLADDTVFNTMTCYSAYASQGEIIKEFMHQFSREFNFPADSQYPQQQFYFRREWDPIKSQMEEFERAHPILGYWKAKDIACQTFWTH